MSEITPQSDISISAGQVESPAETLAASYLSDSNTQNFDLLNDIGLMELSDELGWPVEQINKVVRKAEALQGKPLIYSRRVSEEGMRSMACVSRDLADTIRLKLSYRIDEYARPLAALATESTLPIHAYEKLIAAAGLANAVKIGRYASSRGSIDAQPKISFMVFNEAEQVKTWANNNPNYPLLTLQQLLIASGSTSAETIRAMQRLTDFSPVNKKNATNANVEDDDFRLARQYLTDKRAAYEAIDGGAEAIARLHELFATNANSVLPARLILKWLGTTPQQVLRHAPPEKDTRALYHLEDIFINYVAALVRPSLKGGAN